MNFSDMQRGVALQFSKMKDFPLFRVNVPGDELWQLYLDSFPAGTNPMYRERTEHDCSCCRHFIRTMGNVVALTDKGLESIWDVELPERAVAGYGVVAKALADRVKAGAICDEFLHYENTVGHSKTFEDVMGQVKTWEHFHVTLPRSVVHSKLNIPSLLGRTRGQAELFQRALDTISLQSIDTVLELIAQNSIYRGQEFKPLLEAFRLRLASYQSASTENRRHYAWHAATHKYRDPAVLTIRNSAIGTLLVDLSEDMALEDAVKSFEAKVAPANYKRPKALATKAMIDAAKKDLDKAGLMPALQRRYATLEDITINNVLFADRSVRAAFNGDVFDQLVAETPVKPESFSKVEEIPVSHFIAEVLPKATGLSVLVENQHIGNFVSLIAPTDPTAPRLFKWDNGFSWSYKGDVADSIKERVKKAGGNIEADLCCRLAWNNADDLDLHMLEPKGTHIYYENRRRLSSHGGMLDVDMNGCDEVNNVDPVENIFYRSVSSLRPGKYSLKVHCYSKRNNDPDRQGFEVEIDLLGESTLLSYPAKVKSQDMITVADIVVTKEREISIVPSSDMQQTGQSQQTWGIKTNTFVPVKAVMLSPNYWDEQKGVGNSHWFFMLQGCANEDVARGFYNEFLNNDLLAHRKVLELIGSKVTTAPSEQQLSGIGFSSTQRASLLCRVTGAFTRVVRIIF